MRRRIFIGLILALLVAPPAIAQDFMKGVAAYKRGDYAGALKELRPLAAKGDSKAQNSLGFLYHKGHGVPQNDAQALGWFRKAAAQGHARAQFNIGLMYSQGQGVAQDYATAANWFRKAAEQGFAKAQYNLGVRYAKGQGVPQDDAKSMAWLRKAAAQGHAEAKKSLRFMEEKRQKMAKKKKAQSQPKAAKAPPAPTRGGFHVQIGAVKSKALAVKEAGRLTRVHKPVLGSLEFKPVRADLGKRGVFFRLRAGPLGDRATAAALCRKLSARKQSCIVIKP